MHDALRESMKTLTIVAACMFASLVSYADPREDPVVDAAREALRTGDFSPIAIWVEPAQEPSLQAAFRYAIQVRALGAEGRALADRYFLETAVRLHEESARELVCVAPAAGAAFARSERVLAATDERALVDLVVAQVREELGKRVREIESSRPRRRGDITGGRAYVARYRELVRYVAAVYAAATAAIIPPDDEPDHYEY